MADLDFQQILDRRAPGFPIEMRPEGAPLGDDVHHVLILAEKLAAGTATADIPVPLVGEKAAEGPTGAGSRASAMYDALFSMVTGIRVTLLPVDEPSGGTAMTKTLTMSGAASATADFELPIHVAGEVIKVAVATGDTLADIATAIDTAINAASELPVASTVATEVATVADKTKGVNGNGIVIGFGDPREGADEVTSYTAGGVTCTVADGVAGAGVPDLTAAIANMGEVRYDTVLTSFNDAATLTVLEAEMDRRFHAETMLQGTVFAADQGTDSELTTFGLTRNSEYTCYFGVGESVTLPWVGAALYAGADVLERFPNTPRRNTELKGMVAPPISKRPARIPDRELLLRSGISTFYVDPSGKCRVDLPITTYQKTPLGVADDSMLLVTTMRSLSAYRQRWFATKSVEFSGKLIVDDGQITDADVPSITLEAARSISLAFFRAQAARGLVRNEAAFIETLNAALNPANDTRFDLGHFPTLVKELTQVATFVGFS